jgi:hypothetical protein
MLTGQGTDESVESGGQFARVNLLCIRTLVVLCSLALLLAP